MPAFSRKSQERLETGDPVLRAIFEEVVKTFDCTIICGHRTEVEQNKRFEEKKSQKRWPQSKHNTTPSQAVDVAAYPIDWNDRERQSYFAGFVMGIAAARGYKIRWGGDWNRDWQVKDNAFDDLWHFELVY